MGFLQVLFQLAPGLVAQVEGQLVVPLGDLEAQQLGLVSPAEVHDRSRAGAGVLAF